MSDVSEPISLPARPNSPTGGVLQSVKICVICGPIPLRPSLFKAGSLSTDFADWRGLAAVSRDGGSQDHAVSSSVGGGAVSGLLICGAGAPSIHETGSAANAVSAGHPRLDNQLTSNAFSQTDDTLSQQGRASSCTGFLFPRELRPLKDHRLTGCFDRPRKQRD